MTKTTRVVLAVLTGCVVETALLILLKIRTPDPPLEWYDALQLLMQMPGLAIIGLAGWALNIAMTNTQLNVILFALQAPFYSQITYWLLRRFAMPGSLRIARFKGDSE